MSEEQKWQTVVNKKKNKIISPSLLPYDPIISRQKETFEKNELEKLEKSEIKYNPQINHDQDWNYISIGKILPKQKKVQPQYVASAIKQTNDDDIIKIKKVSKNMAKNIIDARIARKWTQIQLAHNSAIDVKTINEIEKGGCVYDANIFNKLCKTLCVNIDRNYDLV